MRGIIRWTRGPLMATVAAAAIVGSAAIVASAAPAALAGPVPSTAVPHTIVGKWHVQGGIFRFYKEAKPKNTYTDQVIKQRTGVFCPKVNDHNKQIVVHKSAKNPRVYTGSWKWFYTGSCSFAGWGPVKITLWKSYKSATFVSDPPKGTSGEPETFTITRAS
jgi:hypothetical protein